MTNEGIRMAPNETAIGYFLMKRLTGYLVATYKLSLSGDVILFDGTTYKVLSIAEVAKIYSISLTLNATQTLQVVHHGGPIAEVDLTIGTKTTTSVLNDVVITSTSTPVMQ
jgi:hypothetical protein